MKKQKGNKEWITLSVDEVGYKTRPNKKFESRKPYTPLNPMMVSSFMPGNIQKVFVEQGQKVQEGDQLCVLEAMKMKNIMLAPENGIVKRVNVKEGDMVPKNHPLVELK